MKANPVQDTDLFRQALVGVTPLPPSGRITSSGKPLRFSPLNFTSSHHVTDNLSDHGAGDTAINEFLRPGLNRMTLRKLRHGNWRKQDELDLHGLNTAAAKISLAEFLQDSTQQGLRCVNVIHGKGWRSEGRDGTLKVLTRHWLTQHPQVLAFCEAAPQAGGGGAVYVLLKSQKDHQAINEI